MNNDQKIFVWGIIAAAISLILGLLLINGQDCLPSAKAIIVQTEGDQSTLSVEARREAQAILDRAKSATWDVFIASIIAGFSVSFFVALYTAARGQKSERSTYHNTSGTDRSILEDFLDSLNELFSSGDDAVRAIFGICAGIGAPFYVFLNTNVCV
ncbi:MAG: hypothetical protein ACX939_12290 [Hyphococcus sp.]